MAHFKRRRPKHQRAGCLFEPRPISSTDDVLHGCHGNPIPRGERPMTAPRRFGRSDGVHIGLRQNPVRRPPLASHVDHVSSVIRGKKVIGPNASTHVAAVTNFKAFRDGGALRLLERESMRPDESRVVSKENPVTSAAGHGPAPHPATPTAIDLFPETISDWADMARAGRRGAGARAETTGAISHLYRPNHERRRTSLAKPADKSHHDRKHKTPSRRCKGHKDEREGKHKQRFHRRQMTLHELGMEIEREMDETERSCLCCAGVGCCCCLVGVYEPEEPDIRPVVWAA